MHPLFLLFCLLFTSLSLYAQPTITSISPNFGPSNSSTAVTITGSGFTDATDVLFGSTPAASFVVNSDSSITAYNDSAVPGVNDITVVAVSGTSPIVPADLFVFQGYWYCYVPQAGTPATLKAIQLPSNTLQPDQALTVNVNGTPKGISLTPDGRFVLVTNSTADSLTIIDIAFDTTTTISVGSNPIAVAITPNGQKAYVVNTNDGSISVIALTETPSVIATITGMDSPQDIAIIPDGSKAYVADKNSDSVIVIDTTSNTISTSVGGGTTKEPVAVAATPDGTRIYVVCTEMPFVYTIDTTTDSLIGTAISVSSSPTAISIQPAGTTAYVSSPTTSKIDVINLLTNTVTTLISLSGASTSAITPDSFTGYFAGTGPPANIRPLNLSINALGAQIDGFITPANQQITPDQAPLASFIVTTALVGSPCTFDATNSVSPVGDIETYDWDFGDGNTLSTDETVINYTYATAGTFTVTLTVTNSAGTSTSSTTTFTGKLVSNNGNDRFPVATQTITILSPTPPPPTTVAPPSHFQGKIRRHIHRKKPFFSMHTSWKKSPSNDVISYQVFGNNKLLATITSTNKLLFKKYLNPRKLFYLDIHDYKKFLRKKYKVRAVSSTGATSSFVYLKKIKSKR